MLVHISKEQPTLINQSRQPVKKIVLPHSVGTAIWKTRFFQQEKMFRLGHGAKTSIAPFMDLDGALRTHLRSVLLAGESINSDCDAERADRGYS